MLAIIIPYYKLTFFNETIQSLANQTDKRFNVYIGDDASPENPLELLDNYKGKFEYTYHRFEDNLGGISLTKHWERCIALSGDEEWLMIFGDDDVLGTNVVEEFYKQLPIFEGKTNVVRFATQVINENHEAITNKFEHPVWENAADSFYRKYLGKTRSSLSEYVFKRTAYLKCRFQHFPLGWHSDDYAWLDFSQNKPIYTVNDSIVYIRVSNKSISGKTDNDQLKRNATYLFHKQLIIKKNKLFNTNQQLKLLLDFEVSIKNKRKLSMKEWSLLFYLYLKVLKLVPLIKFLRRFLISAF